MKIYDLTKQTPEQIVAELMKMCQVAADEGMISANVVEIKRPS